MDGTILSAISDTGTSSTAGNPTDPFVATNEISAKVFGLPTGGTAPATTVAKLHLNIRAPANIVDIVPTLEKTLLSVSKFVDTGYIAVYDVNEVNFYEKSAVTIREKAVLHGYRCLRENIWRVQLQPIVINEKTDTILLDSPCGQQITLNQYIVPSTPTTQEHLKANMEQGTDTIGNVYELPIIEQIIRYLHVGAGFSTKTTWLKAIRKGNYNTCPLLTVKNVNKHFPESEETQQGHMRSQRQGVRSTKVETGIKRVEEEKKTGHKNQQAPTFPKQEDIQIKIHYTNDTMYTDQNGNFPHISSRGNLYQIISYHVDSNPIWVEPMKNRTEGEMIQAQSRAVTRMKICGIIPTKQALDNEASSAYKASISESNMTYQLVPPNEHRRNIAEKDIKTYKDHFVAVLSVTANNFPLYLWCQIIPHMERQLNLLTKSHALPHISTYAQLYGHHDYNTVPFFPLEIEALTHDKPN